MKNADLTSFLQQLSNTELAYFYKYRFNDFLEGSKQKILNEFRGRSINPAESDRIIEQQTVKDTVQEGKFIFPRCKSDKYYVNKEKKLWMNDDELMIEYDDFSDVCLVCGYVNEGRSNFKQAIARFFKNIFSSKKTID